MSVALYALALSVVPIGGRAEFAVYAPVIGGIIANPSDAAGQGIPVVEVLYLDPTGEPAVLEAFGTTIAIQPGQTYTIPANQTTNISVNAATSGHRFSGYIFQNPTPFPPQPQPGTFPPSGPTTLTETIPAYLYKEYDDDEDLQAFFAAYNALAQQYVTWFATISLPVYTGAEISGNLLNWVAEGLYGMVRPSLSSGLNRDLGPLNTYGMNQFVPLNTIKRIGPSNVALTTDDVFKRIMTWNFYKGDGNVFNLLWLKRRIMRFLIGIAGTAPNIDQTSNISVVYGGGSQIAIRITVNTRSISSGAFPNRFGPNQFVPLNSLRTVFHPGPPAYPLESVLKEAIDSGVLQLPFQFTFVVLI